jgi:hypothetical protein
MSETWEPPFATGLVSLEAPSALTSNPSADRVAAAAALERWRAAFGQGNEIEIERLVQQAHMYRNHFESDGRIGSMPDGVTGAPE